MRPTRRLAFAGAALVLTGLAAPATAAASGLIGRNAQDVRLGVSKTGKVALVSFNAQGRRWRIRAWGAINALHPTEVREQVQFRLDYSGGKPFRRTCGRYDGPRLQYLVAACKAPDGSYWALQQWPRIVGVGDDPAAAVWELHLSHWRGETAQLNVKLDWVDWSRPRAENLYGRLTYLGTAVHGFRSTRKGAPRDSYGRNVYIDTFNSRHGPGWRRENGILARRPTGGFCYALARAPGTAYRMSVVGPGVTPDVFWQSNSPGPYNRTRDLQANAEQRQLLGRAC
jgi:hypothetical protein